MASMCYEEHPIAQFQYETETKVWEIAGEKLSLTTLRNVERSIDQVIEWLEARNLVSNELENLAPYFGVVWPSAVALAAYLNQPSVKPRLVGRRFLELGCGLAIPSLIVSKAGGFCTAVDNHPSVPYFLRANVAHNEPLTISFKSPDDALRDSRSSSHRYDWIVASDVLYDKSLVKIFVEMVCELGSKDAQCVVTDPGRAYLQDFVSEMHRAGWSSELAGWTVPAHSADDGKASDIYVLIFTRNNVG